MSSLICLELVVLLLDKLPQDTEGFSVANKAQFQHLPFILTPKRTWNWPSIAVNLPWEIAGGCSQDKGNFKRSRNRTLNTFHPEILAS
ncbi:hypothetical protein Y1Q_0006782 [Alligator mississippiensis]|uniref:Uncharacterized protein n=1 Tax=Alligator mississippiensis TaxID=8496 RepID=A0A151MYY0_ALLMI|nr:hypothetical protein Y1Q_0006782 [Alligator mississippiensis]